MPLKVSVIVLSFNGRDHILKCLRSLSEQDYPCGDFEIIVADNASTDGTPELVEKNYPQLKLIRFESNLGFSEGNNRAALQASGSFLAFVNQDVVVDGAWLRHLAGALDKNGEAAACHSNMVMPWAPEFTPSRRGAPSAVHYYELSFWGFARYIARPFTPEIFETVNLSGAAMIVRKEFFRDDGYLFDPDFFLYGEDLDMALRIQGRGRRILLVPEAVVFHEQRSPGSVVAGSLLKAHRAIRNRMLAYYKNMRWYEFLPFLPVLVIGSPVKASGFGVSPLRKVIYGMILLPLTFTALGGFVFAWPRFSGRRRRILRQRSREPFWLWKRLGGKIK